MARKFRKSQVYEFNIYTYPSDGTASHLSAGCATESGKSEHEARRELIRKCHAKGKFVYSLELTDTHTDGGQRAAY